MGPKATGTRGSQRGSDPAVVQAAAEHGIPELAVMANVLNPETESITLNTELETPTLEPATELENPPSESTSNPETAAIFEATLRWTPMPKPSLSPGRHTRATNG